MERNNEEIVGIIKDRGGATKMSRELEIPHRTIVCWLYGTRSPRPWQVRMIKENIEMKQRLKVL